VARIVPQRVSGEDRSLYHVYVGLAELPEGIVSGMTADASIIIARQSDVLRLPRAVVQARADGTATVKVWHTDGIENRTIQVGLRGDVYVEIREGLNAGEQVIAE
jgi:multidrug efflux pump subunit AcrA (membrane-fusion protein)